MAPAMAWSTVNVNYICNAVSLNEPIEVLQILYYSNTTVCVITCRIEDSKAKCFHE